MDVIRPMRVGDASAVLALAKEMHQEGAYAFISFDNEQFVRTLADCMKNGFAWVGEADGKVVSGFLAHTSPYFFSREKIACDYGVFTNKEHRKTRLAFRLLQQYIKWAKEQKVKEIMIGASKGFEKTYADRLGKFLQKRLGFEESGHWYKLRT